METAHERMRGNCASPIDASHLDTDERPHLLPCRLDLAVLLDFEDLGEDGEEGTTGDVPLDPGNVIDRSRLRRRTLACRRCRFPLDTRRRLVAAGAHGEVGVAGGLVVVVVLDAASGGDADDLAEGAVDEALVGRVLEVHDLGARLERELLRGEEVVEHLVALLVVDALALVLGVKVARRGLDPDQAVVVGAVDLVAERAAVRARVSTLQRQRLQTRTHSWVGSMSSS
jgi:hypothetical protein